MLEERTARLDTLLETNDESQIAYIHTHTYIQFLYGIYREV